VFRQAQARELGDDECDGSAAPLFLKDITVDGILDDGIAGITKELDSLLDEDVHVERHVENAFAEGYETWTESLRGERDYCNGTFHLDTCAQTLERRASDSVSTCLNISEDPPPILEAAWDGLPIEVTNAPAPEAVKDPIPLEVANIPEPEVVQDWERPTCLICFETFAEDDNACCSELGSGRKSYVFSSAMKKNKKVRVPCKCQEGKDAPDFLHQQCLWTWQNKLSKNSCPLCRQVMHDPRTIFREAFLSSNDLGSTFLSRPIKCEWGVVQCVIRSVTQFGATRLVMYSQETGNALLEARRTSTSSFLAPEYGIFHEDRKFAKLSSNMMGTTWGLKSLENEELLCVKYSVNRAWLKEPRKMRILAPGITQEGEQVVHVRPATQKTSTSLANILSSEEEVPFGLESFENRFPQWNEELGAYCLNFGGRVRLASVKNFQIMHSGDQPDSLESETLMQFGRVDKEVFHLDVQFPFSPLQAFATCISSFYGKLGVE
jgi:hypothetical protein